MGEPDAEPADAFARPVITSVPGTAATEDVPYVYAPTVDDDGPIQAWSLGVPHSCGGALDPATGVFTFTPAGPVPVGQCRLYLVLCDGGNPVRCAVQSLAIHVAAVDDLRTAVDDGTRITIQDSPQLLINVSYNDLDPDGGPSSSGEPTGVGPALRRGDSPDDMGDNLPRVALGTGRTAVAIEAGDAHTCVLLDDATVKCWGYNADGRLGVGDAATHGDNPGEMGDNLPAVALGAGRTVTALAVGGTHTCALLDNLAIKCWGNSDHGQLGHGTNGYRGTVPGDMGDSLLSVGF